MSQCVAIIDWAQRVRRGSCVHITIHPPTHPTGDKRLELSTHLPVGTEQSRRLEFLPGPPPLSIGDGKGGVRSDTNNREERLVSHGWKKGSDSRAAGRSAE